MTPPPDVGAARERLLEILSRPEFRQAPPARVPWLDALDRLVAAFLEGLGRVLFGGASSGAAPVWPRALLWALVAVVGSVAAVVAFRSARQLLRGPSSARLRHPRGPAPRADDLPDRFAEAHRLAAAGAHRDALRVVFQAVLLGLDRAGLIRYRLPATNREYLRELNACRPELSAHLRVLIEQYEVAWYGGHSASEADWARALEAATRLLEAAGQEPARGGGTHRARPA